MACARCGLLNPPAMTFCGHCGVALSAEHAAAPTTAVAVSPSAVQASPTPVGRPEVRGDRRVVTVVFADLAGFTRLAESLDPEETSSMLYEVLGELMEEVRARGGWVEKNVGDAILAVFGAPVAHDDDAVRAVRSALAMQERMRALKARLAGRFAHPIALHVGVNTGLVVMGPRTEEQRGDADEGQFMVVGDAVNVGARLQQAAGADQVLVGASTYAATRSIFSYSPHPPVVAKGKQDPLIAYECLGMAATSKDGPAAAHGISAPLVGRQADVDVFFQAVGRLMEGQGGLLSVVGSAGLGKSRLVAEVRGRLTGAGLNWLEGHALSFGQKISYLPFLEILRRDAGISEEDGDAGSLAKLERRVGELFPGQEAEVVPYLATMLALSPRTEHAESLANLSGDAIGRQVFLTTRRYFERLALERPTVLVLEDLHWLDESSAALVEHLLPLVKTVPLLICGIARLDHHTPATRLQRLAATEYGDPYTAVTLKPLGKEDSTRLVEQLVPVEAAALRRRIAEKAEGNPFFAEEIVRSLIDMKALVRDESDGRWQFVRPVEALAIPDTLRGVILARLDLLGDEVKELLRTAAVIGRAFDVRVLCEIEGDEVGVQRQLRELQQLELVEEKEGSAEREYQFKHALIHEVAYESTLVQRRRLLHRRVAQAIEQLFTDRIEELAGILAHHYARAEDWEKAQVYLLRAGDQASKLAADAEALAHYREALDAYGKAFQDRWDPLQRATIERKIGEALFRRGDHNGALQYLHRALGLLGSPYPDSPTSVRRALLRELTAQVRRRLGRSRAEDGAGGLPPPLAVEEQVRVYRDLCWIDYHMDHRRFVLDSLLELNVAEQSGHVQGIVHGSAALGMILDLVGGLMVPPVLHLAEWYHRRAVELADRGGSLAGIGFAYLSLGYYEHNCLVKLETALEHYRRSADAFWEAGDLREWGGLSWMIAWVLRLRGEVEASMERCQQMIRVGRDAADRQVWGTGLEGLARNLWQSGRVEEAVPHLEQAILLLESIPDYQAAATARADLGQCYLRLGQVDRAVELLEETARLIEEHHVRDFLCSYARGEAYLAAADRAEGSQRKALVRKARAACDAALRLRRYSREGVAGPARHRGTSHWLEGDARRARHWWDHSLALAEAAGTPYEAAMTHLEVGQRTQDASHLARAEAILQLLRPSILIAA